MAEKEKKITKIDDKTCLVVRTEERSQVFSFDDLREIRENLVKKHAEDLAEIDEILKAEK